MRLFARALCGHLGIIHSEECDVCVSHFHKGWGLWTGVQGSLGKLCVYVWGKVKGITGRSGPVQVRLRGLITHEEGWSETHDQERRVRGPEELVFGLAPRRWCPAVVLSATLWALAPSGVSLPPMWWDGLW